MPKSIKQIVKGSAFLKSLLHIPLRMRRVYLTEKYRSAFSAMQRLGDLAMADIRLSVTEFDGQFWISPQSNLFQRIVIYGHYEPNVSRMFLDHVDPAQDVIDVGANVGFYTVGAARRLKTGRVLAIEPTQGAFGRLRLNAELNQLNGRVILEKAIASDSAGVFTMNIIEGREEYSSIGDLVHPSAKGRDTVTESVPAHTLDSLVEKHGLRPSLIKIDVEGAEMKVLLGAQNTIRQFKPYIMAECSEFMLQKQGSSSREIVKMVKSSATGSSIRRRPPRRLAASSPGIFSASQSMERGHDRLTDEDRATITAPQR